MDPMLIQMKDMPPNPENGEFFLPAFIVEELNSGIVYRRKKNQLCYAAVVAGYGRVKTQQINSSDKRSDNTPPNSQGNEKKAEQVVPIIEPKLSWAQVVKKEVNSPKNNMRVPPQSSSSTSSSSSKPQKVKGKVISPNKQVTHPNSARKMSGKKK